MRKIYTLVIALFLTIISFGQTWEEIEVPEDILIADVAFDGNDFYIAFTGNLVYLCNEELCEWNVVMKSSYRLSGSFIRRSDSLIYYSSNNKFILFESNFSKLLPSSLKFTSTYPYIHVTKNGIIITDTYNSDGQLSILRSQYINASWDTTLVIKNTAPSSAGYGYVCDIIENKKGELYMTVFKTNGSGYNLYKSIDNAKSWVQMNIDITQDPYMWFDTEDCFCINLGKSSLKYSESDFIENPNYNNVCATIIDEHNNIYASEKNGKIKWSNDNGMHWNYYSDTLNVGVKKFVISDNGFLYALTDYKLYRLSVPINEKVLKTTAINQSQLTNNSLNGYFRIYSVMGTYCGIIEIQNGNFSALNEKLKKGIYILQSIDTNQIIKIKI